MSLKCIVCWLLVVTEGEWDSFVKEVEVVSGTKRLKFADDDDEAE